MYIILPLTTLQFLFRRHWERCHDRPICFGRITKFENCRIASLWCSGVSGEKWRVSKPFYRHARVRFYGRDPEDQRDATLLSKFSDVNKATTMASAFFFFFQYVAVHPFSGIGATENHLLIMRRITRNVDRFLGKLIGRLTAFIEKLSDGRPERGECNASESKVIGQRPKTEAWRQHCHTSIQV